MCPLTQRLAPPQPKPPLFDFEVSSGKTSCLYSYSTSPGTLCISPYLPPSPSRDWLTLSTLLRLRRTKPSQLGPLWSDKYDLNPWFNRGPLSLYQFGTPGSAIATILLDAANSGNAITRIPLLRCFVTLSSLFILAALTPLSRAIEALAVGAVTSKTFWRMYPRWSRIYHAPFPLKLYLAQLAFKGYGALEKKAWGWIEVREQLGGGMGDEQ